ncbi:Gfo/Idh/MocA family oxidoreductase [Microbacterium sp. JZ37]|uniref:Gfo/Idh/MocA family protein n=1 Tax=Microbacterium sp. JZ37 TaxID=2654193 RepID=UPI002B47F400|nr:Gfo/Idh/MocA family oxidoreductase [Microbacterium sp. JZ37]WRH16323.1 gfo/Idh/MocA family oxidoreductase [Microbacterium sp. JZ37]
MPTGVGIIGAGPGAAALHVPTLARLGDRFAVVHVADAGSGRAAAIAAPLGARASSSAEELLADPAVEVVVIASPPERHAGQVLAAVAAGKRGVLCEKPLALAHGEVDAVLRACREAGVALIVGTNHLHDPAWGRAKHFLIARRERVQSISVTVSLPANDRYHAAVTEFADRGVAAPARSAPDWSDTGFAAAVLRQLVLGLAIHDAPLLRDLAPRLDEVVFARPVPPIGYAIGFRAGDVLVQLATAMVPDGAEALWRVSIRTEGDGVEIDFPPSFVHDGSAEVRIRHDDGRLIRHPRAADDGYVALWRAFAAALDGDAPVEYDEIAADAHYAIDLADAVADAVRSAA